MTVPVWLKGATILCFTLCAGVLVGMAIERHHSPVRVVSRMDSHHVMHALRHELDLDSAQHERIVATLGHHQQALDSSWHTMQPHIRATLDTALREILAVLRPEQRERYLQLVNGVHPGLLR